MIAEKRTKNNAVVIYSSKYGFTQRYAQWISEALASPLFEAKTFRPADFVNYDVIIFGGGLYAGGVSGIKLLTENWNLLSGKQVILFTCGLADPAEKATIDHIRQGLAKALPAAMMDALTIFHLRGGIDYPSLSLIHRAMMAMLRRTMLKKDVRQRSEEDLLFLDTYGKAVDFTDQAAIAPLITYVEKCRQV